ncbi:MAG: histidinol-phosphatase HisJ [Sediminispirochaetaceae bacterium]
MITNYHTHSSFCDGKGQLEDYVKYALSRGFHALGFSGHAPLPFPNDWTMNEENLSTYIREVLALKERYRDSLEICLGLETDYLDKKHNPAHPKYKALGLDYQIGSVHHLYSPERTEFLQVDYTKEELELLLKDTFDKDIKALVSTYYRMVREMVQTGGFEILGHLDLVKKQNRGNVYFDETEKWYKREIEKTLETVAETDVILEINTGAMARGYTAEPYPSPWIIDRAAELKIPVTINSDAHRPEWLDYGFEEAENLARAAGYSSKIVYTEGEWREIGYE